jgi:hypothetical protein
MTSWLFANRSTSSHIDSEFPLGPKRHHFDPALHLRHFVGEAPKGQVWTYDKQAGNARPATPENTAVQSHFYSVQRDDGSMDTTIEEYLAEVESDAAPIYEGLLRGEIPGHSQLRADFAQFLALMHVRTPAMRRMAGELRGREIQIRNYAYATNPEAFDALLRRIEKKGGPVYTAEQKEQLRQGFLDPTDYVIEVSGQQTLTVLKIADKLAPIFFDMKWSIVRSLGGFFITTDNPLVREVDPKTRHPVLGDRGFLNKTSEIIYPLSPTCMLLMSWDQAAPSVGVFPPDHVNNVNRGLAAHSDRYLYAHLRDDKISQLAAQFKDSRPRMTTQGFGPKKFAQVEVARRVRAS